MQRARQAGATGGKLLGAGGTGFRPTLRSPGAAATVRAALTPLHQRAIRPRPRGACVIYRADGVQNLPMTGKPGRSFEPLGLRLPSSTRAQRRAEPPSRITASCARTVLCAFILDREGRVVLVEQYRPPLGRMTLEMPAGTIERRRDAGPGRRSRSPGGNRLSLRALVPDFALSLDVEQGRCNRLFLYWARSPRRRR